MRIMYVSGYYKPAYVYGGTVSVVAALCEELVKLGVGLSVLTTNLNGNQKLDVPLERETLVDGVSTVYFPTVSTPLSNYYSPQLIKTFQDKIMHYDIVILDGIWSFTIWQASVLANHTGVPYIVPLHGQLMPWSLGQKRLKKWLYMTLYARRILNNAAALHCASFTEANALSGLRLQSPTFVVPYGVDTKRFTSSQSSGYLHHVFNIPNEHLIFGTLGRIHTVKRPEVALAAWGRLKRSDVHLVFIGPDEGGLQGTLVKQAEMLGCAEQLHFTGLLNAEKVVDALADTDLLMMPSIMESFGNAAVEAMAAGVPVLVSDQVPVGHWVEQAQAGKVVPCTVDDFAQALTECLQSPDLLAGMGQHGRRIAMEQFDISAAANRLFVNLDAIITTGKPSAMGVKEY